MNRMKRSRRMRRPRGLVAKFSTRRGLQFAILSARLHNGILCPDRSFSIRRLDVAGEDWRILGIQVSREGEAPAPRRVRKLRDSHPVAPAIFSAGRKMLWDTIEIPPERSQFWISGFSQTLVSRGVYIVSGAHSSAPNEPNFGGGMVRWERAGVEKRGSGWRGGFSMWRFWNSIPRKREFLASLLSASGGVRALEAIGRARGPSIVALTYHRIARPGMESNPYYDPVVSATPEGFRDQMLMVRRHFRVGRPLDSLEPSDDRRPVVLVTFDDGYRDNHDAALPILQELGIPATFFIPTSFLERPRLPWWDHVAHVLKKTRVPLIELQRWPGDDSPAVLELGPNPSPKDREAVIMGVIRLFLDGEVRDEPWFLSQLEERADVAVDSPALGRELFMGWDHLRRLARLGHVIGSHGHAHEALGTLSERDQRRDLALSRTILEMAVGAEVRAVAYPYGWPGAFDPRTVELAGEVGHVIGFTAIEGVNRPDDPGFNPLALRRLNVGSGDTPALLRGRAALHGALGWSAM